jgi:D-xylose transport system ATP-binding protein
MNGQPFRAKSVLEAEAFGIALVPQELDVVPELTVAENMFLNAEPHRFGFIARAERHARAARVLSSFDITIAPEARMGDLDLVTQELVVIARALSKNAKVLILDEPTAALTEHEVTRLFDQVRSLCLRGMACIYVSHRLAEVFAIAQRIVVMRDGSVIGEHQVRGTTRETIVKEMVGGAELARAEAAEPEAEAALALEVTDFKVSTKSGRPLIQHLSFSVKKGEILGLFGLLGAGCPEMLQALFGVWHGESEGEVRVHGKAVHIESPPDAIAARLGMMAQDRRDARSSSSFPKRAGPTNCGSRRRAWGRRSWGT